MRVNLKKITKEWYEILRQEGFKDIENHDGSLKPIIRRDHVKVKNFEIHREYFMLCADYLNRAKFSSEMEKRIWELNCEGHSLRMICKEVNTYYKKVITIIHKHLILSGIKDGKWKKY